MTDKISVRIMRNDGRFLRQADFDQLPAVGDILDIAVTTEPGGFAQARHTVLECGWFVGPNASQEGACRYVIVQDSAAARKAQEEAYRTLYEGLGHLRSTLCSEPEEAKASIEREKARP